MPEATTVKSIFTFKMSRVASTFASASKSPRTVAKSLCVSRQRQVSTKVSGSSSTCMPSKPGPLPSAIISRAVDCVVTTEYWSVIDTPPHIRTRHCFAPTPFSSAKMAVLVRIQPTTVSIVNVSEKFLQLTGYTRGFLGIQAMSTTQVLSCTHSLIPYDTAIVAGNVEPCRGSSRKHVLTKII